jgi:hypothetical protein
VINTRAIRMVWRLSDSVQRCEKCIQLQWNCNILQTRSGSADISWRPFTVSFMSATGIFHSVEVEAETFYEAVGLGWRG